MRWLAPLVFALAAVPQYLEAATYLNPKLSSKGKTIHFVALLPPTAEMTVTGLGGYDLKEKESEALASAVSVVVSGALRKMGWEVNDSAFFSEALQDKEQLRYLVGYLRARHETLLRQIKPKDVLRGRHSLGERVAGLSAQLPADALVFVHGIGDRPSTALKVGRVVSFGPLGVLLGSLAAHVSLRISLVDPHTGEVLCYSVVSRATEEQILNELGKIGGDKLGSGMERSPGSQDKGRE